MERTCKVTTCTNRVNNGGLCSAHHSRLREYGDPLAGPPVRRKTPPGLSPEQAFAYYMGTELPAARHCWLWLGTITPTGYGVVMVRGKNIQAHRLSYTIFNGPLAADQIVRHTCDNPPCVNPHHLAAGSQAQNMQDCTDRGRQALGSALPISRLTPEIVREIRGLRGRETQQAIADRFGVHPGTIQALLDGKTWKHVV